MKKPTIAIKNQLRQIRPFVTFNYDLRKKIAPQSIAKIRKYHAEIERQNVAGRRMFRPRKKEHLKIALKRSYTPPKLQKQMKAVVIPFWDKKARIRIDTTKREPELALKIEQAVVQEKFVYFDAVAMAKNPKQYLQNSINKIPAARSFNVICGKGKIDIAFHRDDIIDRIIGLMNKYKNWGDWLYGLSVYKFKRQASVKKYKKAKQKAAKKRKKKKRK